MAFIEIDATTLGVVVVVAAVVYINLPKGYLLSLLSSSAEDTSASENTAKKKRKKKKTGANSEFNRDVDTLIEEVAHSGNMNNKQRKTASRKANGTKNIPTNVKVDDSLPVYETEVHGSFIKKESQRERKAKARAKEIKGVPMPVDESDDEEHPTGDVLHIKAPAPSPKTVQEYATEPAEEGWERANAGSQPVVLKLNTSKISSIKAYKPAQPKQVKEEPLTATQRKNKAKNEKARQVREANRVVQEERLRRHRAGQTNIPQWKPPPPTENKWYPQGREAMEAKTKTTTAQPRHVENQGESVWD